MHALVLSQMLKYCSCCKVPFAISQGPVDPGRACPALAQAKVVFKHIQQGAMHMQGSCLQQVIWQILLADMNLVIPAPVHVPPFCQCSCKMAPHAHAPQENEPHSESDAPGKKRHFAVFLLFPNGHVHAAGTASPSAYTCAYNTDACELCGSAGPAAAVRSMRLRRGSGRASRRRGWSGWRPSSACASSTGTCSGLTGSWRSPPLSTRR